MLGRTAAAALGTAGADAALRRITANLALLAAQERITAAAEDRARRFTQEATEREVPDYSNVEDPSELPPASAGTNGTKRLLSSKADRERIFARTPAGSDPETTAILLTGIALAPPARPRWSRT